MTDHERITDRIRVLLADDHRMVREALKAVLEPECEIVAEAGTGEEAVALAMRTSRLRKRSPQPAPSLLSPPGQGEKIEESSQFSRRVLLHR